MSRLKYEYPFAPGAKNDTAAAVAQFASSGGAEVLDVGSGAGRVARYLAAEQGRTVTVLGSDSDAVAAVNDLDESGLRALQTDLEAATWDAPIAGETFDVVILDGALERLRGPDTLLGRIRDAGILREDGALVLSVSNASHQSVVSELLVGDFRYTDGGILDENQLRWFTLTSLRRLLEQSGFVIERVHRTTRALADEAGAERGATLEAELRERLGELNPETTTYEFVVLARARTYASELAQRTAEHEAQTRELFESRERAVAELENVRAELERTRQLVEEQREYFDSELRAGAAEVASLRAVHKRGSNSLKRRAIRAAKRQVRRNAELERLARRLRDKVKGRG